MPRLHPLSLCAAVGALMLAACGEATPPEACTEDSSGSLTVSISGVPAGATGLVTLTGPGGSIPVTSSTTLTGVATGAYSVTATPTVVADSIISSVFAAASLPATLCIREGGNSLTAVFTRVASSGRLWFGAGFYTAGFGVNTLNATATLDPAALVGTRGGAGVTFDRSGNLWVRGQTETDPVLMRYPAASLAGTGNPLPDRSIGIAGLTCLGPTALAFDADGNLWISLGCQGRIVRLTPAQYGASGIASPTVQITGLTAPEGLAFDGSGNLWVADLTHLRRYDAARLSAAITTPANLSVAFSTPTPPAPGASELRPSHLAFRPNGELWVGSSQQRALFRVEAAVRAASGAQVATATRILYLNDFSQPKGFAFDNAGGLFVATEQSRFGRLAPTQLDVNSTPAAPTVPQRSFASGSILAFGDDIAIFPAPSGTPLYHRVP
jgi:sugar lactone lactonase YvrE